MYNDDIDKIHDELFSDEFWKSMKEEYRKIREKTMEDMHKGWKKPESPYVLNNNLLDMIADLENDFNSEKEREIISLLHRIDEYPDMSRYQLSLTKKALADCYSKYKITGNALELYQSAIEDNPRLPVKRIITKLKSLPTNHLIYSLDVNAVFEPESTECLTTALGTHDIPEEYDPAFEQFVNEKLEELGPDYKDSFYQFLKVRDFEKDPFWTYKQWAQLTLDSFQESKDFSVFHQNCISQVDFSVLKTIEFNAEIQLKPEEIRLLSKVNKMQDLHNLPGYFTAVHHLDYSKALSRLFASGYLAFSSFEYNVNKLTIPQLKEILNSKSVPTKGKKIDLVNRVLENFSETELSDLPEYFVATDSGNDFLKKNDALLTFYNGFSDRNWTCPEEIIEQQRLNPDLTGIDLLIQILNNVIDQTTDPTTKIHYSTDLSTLNMWKQQQ